jgi:hypothetical protein
MDSIQLKIPTSFPRLQTTQKVKACTDPSLPQTSIRLRFLHFATRPRAVTYITIIPSPENLMRKVIVGVLGTLVEAAKMFPVVMLPGLLCDTTKNLPKILVYARLLVDRLKLRLPIVIQSIETLLALQRGP